jgi:bacterioferritin-associated ferredoxin
VRDVFAALGKPAQCGRCARTITHLVKEARKERRNDNGYAPVTLKGTGAA